ncbi:MAG: phosphatidate cytidylyltransferase [Spirochaetia bacterium]
MNNFYKRALLFIIGLPAILFIIIYFDRFSHIGWTLIVVITSTFGSFESLNLFKSNPKRHEKIIIPLFGFLIPSTAWADYFFDLSISLFILSIISGAFIVLLIQLITWKQHETSDFTGNTASLLGALLYPSIFMAYLVRFSEFTSALTGILLFLVLNFSNDTCAYLTGRFLGSGSRHIFAVSPKKTVIGFIGGFIGTLLFGSLFVAYAPEHFSAPWPALLLFFLFIAIIADAGDLLESALKRGAEKKDSGKVVPGRGGMLDSIDSLLFSAPIFYYIGVILFN